MDEKEVVVKDLRGKNFGVKKFESSGSLEEALGEIMAKYDVNLEKAKKIRDELLQP